MADKNAVVQVKQGTQSAEILQTEKYLYKNKYPFKG